MGRNRLPNIMLRSVMRRKTGFYKDWIDLAANSGIILELNGCTGLQMKKALYEVIQSTDENERNTFIEQARASSERDIYSKLNYNLNEHNYFRLDFSRKTIGTIFKVRGELLNLNYMPHRNDLVNICSLCNMGVNENTIHFIGVCPILKELRKLFFGKSYLSDSETKSYLNGEDWLLIQKYTTEAMIYRRRIIDENF